MTIEPIDDDDESEFDLKLKKLSAIFSAILQKELDDTCHAVLLTIATHEGLSTLEFSSCDGCRLLLYQSLPEVGIKLLENFDPESSLGSKH